MGIEPTTKPWQGLVLPLAPYPHIETLSISIQLLTQRIFRLCQETEHWPLHYGSYCPSRMFLYGKLIVGKISKLAFASYSEAFLTIRRLRVPEVNYSPAWMLPADNINHIETHLI